jgi:hypothetical protein
MIKLTAPALMLLGGLGLAGTVSAQCTFDGTIGTSPTTTASTSTCGSNLSFTPFCSGGNNIAGTGAGGADPSGVSIYQVNVGSANAGLTFGVTSTTTGFFPEMALVSGTCSAGASCLIDDTNGSQTVGPDSGGNPLTPAGPYFVIVSALIGGTNVACGSYTLTLAGTLPVKLQSFSID